MFAHHSFAMFDQKKDVTLKGVVREFQWTNPHAFIHIEVPNDSGGKDPWQVELNSPNNLTRQGWKSTSVKAGRGGDARNSTRSRTAARAACSSR